MKRKQNGLVKTVCAIAALSVVLTTSAYAVPIADGRFDPAEGYTTGFNLILNVEARHHDPPTVAPDPGQLWFYQDPNTRDVSVAFVQPVSLIDNTYGDNSIGWGNSAPSGKHHNFKDLVGSDKARFTFTDGHGNVVLDVELDYISEIGHHTGIYESQGVDGKDGKVYTGSASDVLAWGTSLDYNFNTLGHDEFTESSPLSIPDYTDPPSAPGWIFEVVYELRVSGDAFGANEFGGVTIPIVHDSGNKIGKNKVYPEMGGSLGPSGLAIAEAGTLVTLLLGLAGLSRRQRT